MFVRQLQYLVALARTRHFARAAELCHVSQPALSAAIQHLEEELGIAIVRRDQRFHGLTPEGERLLGWAQRVLADWEGLRQEAARSRGEITGTLRIGAIPTTMPVVPLLTSQSRAAYPGIHQAVFSLSAEEIIRRLDVFELDLGLTYLEDQRLGGFRVLALYRERYLLLAPNRGAFRGRAAMTWSEAAELPLCLLTPNMQNRRIIDAAFRQAGTAPNVAVETDSAFALYSHVRCAGLHTIVPHSILFLLDMREEVTAIPLSPELSRPIGLIALGQEPPPPLIAAAWEVFAGLDLQSRFDTLISPAN